MSGPGIFLRYSCRRGHSNEWDQIEATPLHTPRHISLGPASSGYFSNELSCYLTTASRLSIFRAVENGVGLVRPSRRGTSIARDHQGRLLGYKSDCFVGADHTTIVNMPISGGRTLYVLIGESVGWLCIRNAGSGAIRRVCEPPVTGSVGRSSAAGSNGRPPVGLGRTRTRCEETASSRLALAALQVAFIDGDRRQDAGSPGAARSGGGARGGAAAPTDLKIAARPSSGQVRQVPATGGSRTP